MFKFDWIYRSKFYYIIPFLLMDIGFIISYFFKFENVIFDVVFVFLVLIFGLLIIFDLIAHFPKFDGNGGLISQRNDWGNRVVNKLGVNVFKALFILIIIGSLILGYDMKNNVSNIGLISKICLNFGYIIYLSSILKYGYISVNDDKRGFSNSLFLVLVAFFIIISLFPNVFSDFLENFTENLLNVSVTSLTFVLLTATLSLLVFTYNMNLGIGDFFDTGKDYFKATLFSIFISIILFILFFVLELFKINWNSALNISLFVELNVVCIVLFFLAYAITLFVEDFISATLKSIVILGIWGEEDDSSE